MYRNNFRNPFEYIKNYMFEHLTIGDKICYISTIYVYTSGLWAHYLIHKNVIIDTKSLENPLSLMLSSNLYNHFGPYLIPKLLNHESFNKLLSRSNESHFLDNSIRAFNRIVTNKNAINYVFTISNKIESTNEIPDSYGKIWVFNKFFNLLCDKRFYNDTNRSKLIILINSIELLLNNISIEECEVPYQFINDLSIAILDVEDQWIKERLLYILSQLMRNINNIRKVLLVEREGFDKLFDVSNNLLTYQEDFNIFDYTSTILSDYPLLRVLYTEFSNIISNTGQLQDKIIKTLNSVISEEFNSQLPLVDYKYLIDYKIRRFIDEHKLPVQVALVYSSLKDFLQPLKTIGFTQTFKMSVINSFQTVFYLLVCKIILQSENKLINSEMYYKSNIFMLPTSLGITAFNLGFIIKILKYNRNFLLPLILTETII